MAGLLSGERLAIEPEGWERVASPRGRRSPVPSERLPQAHELTILISTEAEIHVKPLRIALLCNLKKHVALRFAAQASAGAPADALAEYDSEETVEGLRAALAAQGHEVIPLEGDETLLDTIRQVQARHLLQHLRGAARGFARIARAGHPGDAGHPLHRLQSADPCHQPGQGDDQADVARPGPAHRALPGVPARRRAAGGRADCASTSGLAFPLFVKPSREGTGMGINGDSVVHDEAELRRQVAWVLDTYHQPALVEPYLPGREFTVGIVGNRLCPDEAAALGRPGRFLRLRRVSRLSGAGR